MSDTGETAEPDVFCFNAIRQDIADPDKAEAEIEFRFVSDGDIELVIRWGGRDRGAYLIPDPKFAAMGIKTLTDRWRRIEKRTE